MLSTWFKNQASRVGYPGLEKTLKFSNSASGRMPGSCSAVPTRVVSVSKGSLHSKREERMARLHIHSLLICDVKAHKYAGS